MSDTNIDPEVAKLAADKAAAEKALAQASESATVKGAMIPKERFDQVNAQKKEALEALDKIATEFVNSVPEDFQHLIPNLTPIEKINWIRDAARSGIFGKQATEGIDTKRPGLKAPQDLNGMSPEQMRAKGYKT